MDDVTIMVRRNGPYRLEGPVTLIDQDGNEFKVPEERYVFLCRCGRSDNKPFCDSTHRKKEPTFDAPTMAV